jgi:cytochrome b pre-mRNA-processing protein 3
MMLPLFRRSARQDTISTLYGTIVAQARLPCFYRDYAVADTVNGRFDLLVLHLAAVLDRLAEDPALRDMGQALFDRFCHDMDHNLREMGVGDLSVPKEMQRMGEAFYGRAQAYRAALAAQGEEPLIEALAPECLWRHTTRIGCAGSSCGLYAGSGTSSQGPAVDRTAGGQFIVPGPGIYCFC